LAIIRYRLGLLGPGLSLLTSSPDLRSPDIAARVEWGSQPNFWQMASAHAPFVELNIRINWSRLVFGFLAESLRRGFTTHPTGTSAVLSLLSFAIVNLLCVCPRQARRW
jgi:hypothetical protein